MSCILLLFGSASGTAYLKSDEEVLPEDIKQKPQGKPSEQHHIPQERVPQTAFAYLVEEARRDQRKPLASMPRMM